MEVSGMGVPKWGLSQKPSDAVNASAKCHIVIYKVVNEVDPFRVY